MASLKRVGYLSAAIFSLGGCTLSSFAPKPTIANTEFLAPATTAPAVATTASSPANGEGTPAVDSKAAPAVAASASAASAPEKPASSAQSLTPSNTVRSNEGLQAKRTVLDHAATVFAQRLYESANDSDNVLKAQTVFRSGRALLDLYCNEYLDALGSFNQHAGNQRKQVSIVGGFVSAVMGLTDSPAKHIAGVATAFSATGSSMDALTTTYLFSDAAGAITKLVRDSQSAYLLSLGESFAEIKYDDAVNLLTGYEQMCRPAHIRSMIDQAIAVSKAIPEEPGALRGEGVVTPVILSLTGAVGRTPTEGDAIALYAWYLADENGRKAVELKSEFVSQLVKNDKDLGKKLASVLLPLTLNGNQVHRRWAAAVAKMQAHDPIPAPAPPTERSPAASKMIIAPNIKIKIQ